MKSETCCKYIKKPECCKNINLLNKNNYLFKLKSKINQKSYLEKLKNQNK